MIPINLLNLSEEELLANVGKEILGKDGFNIDTPDDKILYNIGNKWFIEKKKNIQSQICNNDLIMSLSTTDNNLELFAAIADLIASITINISPFTVSALILKKGLNKYCEENE